jgi:hypothetical protein
MIKMELEILPKVPFRFSWHRVLMEFIEWKLFHDNRSYLTAYERLLRFYLHEVLMIFIEEDLIHDKRRNLTVYEKIRSILLTWSPDDI